MNKKDTNEIAKTIKKFKDAWKPKTPKMMPYSQFDPATNVATIIQDMKRDINLLKQKIEKVDKDLSQQIRLLEEKMENKENEWKQSHKKAV